MKYEMLNKNRVIAIIEVNSTMAHLVEICGEFPNYIRDIQSWIDSRTSPIGRRNIKILLKLSGLNKKSEYLAVTHGISLNDTFWVREIGDATPWEKISPYTNRFSRIISELAINGEYYGGDLKSPSPEYTLDGSADKCWKRINGRIYLYKTSGEKWSGITGNRPYCEYYASQVADALINNKSDYVNYGIKVSKTRQGFLKPYVYCGIFTNERFGYLPICDSKFRSTELPELDKVMPRESRIKLREMLVLDSIVMNYDRHDGNYGFLVDNDTYKLKCMAPIFDQDCSLGGFVSLQSVDNLNEAYEIAKTKAPRTNIGGYIPQARWAMTSELLQNMKNMYPFHFKRLPKDIDLEDERIEFMEYIVNHQIKSILTNKA